MSAPSHGDGMMRISRRYEPRLRLRDVPNVKQTAYHEAGHAVAGYKLHVPFRYVTIVPDEEQGSVGHVLYSALRPDFDSARDEMTEFRLRAMIEPRIICALAGEAAESALTGRRHLPTATSDYCSAVDFALVVTGGYPDEAGAYCTWLYYRVVGVVRNPLAWAAIEALAAALPARERIGSRAARRIIKGAICDEIETQRTVR